MTTSTPGFNVTNVGAPVAPIRVTQPYASNYVVGPGQQYQQQQQQQQYQQYQQQQQSFQQQQEVVARPLKTETIVSGSSIPNPVITFASNYSFI